VTAASDQVTAAAPAEPQLLDARELVAELGRLGAGQWSRDAVRQWIREEPACPIARVGVQGQPHRYSLLVVLDWLLERERREKPKGYSRADGAATVAVLEEARKKLLTETLPIFAANGAAAPKGSGGAVDKIRKDPEVAALARAIGVTPTRLAQALAEHEMVLNRFRDPRSWKAHEEARLARMKADEQEGLLVPAGEVDALLEDLVLTIRAALQALPGQLAPALELCTDAFQRRAAIEQHVDGILLRLAKSSTPEGASHGGTDASS
jgi:phage terminase Nu1 subunit (DNA packaging protein)